MYGSPSGMFLPRRSSQRPTKTPAGLPHRFCGEGRDDRLEPFHDLPQAEPTYTMGNTFPLLDGLGGTIGTARGAVPSRSGSGGGLCKAGADTPVLGANWPPPRRREVQRAVIRHLLPLLSLRKTPPSFSYVPELKCGMIID
jgi:hypothetical protein